MADFDLLDPSTWGQGPDKMLGNDIGPGVNDLDFMDKFTSQIGEPAKVPEAPKAAPTKLTDDEIVGASLNQIRAGLSDADTLALMAESEKRGNRMTKDNKVLADYRTLNDIDFVTRYGSDIHGELVNYSIRARNYLASTTPERTLEETAWDGVVSAAGGFEKGAVSLATLPAYLAPGSKIKEGMLGWAAETNEGIDERTNRLQSKELNRREYADSIRKALDDADGKAIADEDKADDKNLVDWFASHGREFLKGAGDQIVRAAEDPAMALDWTTDGVGSMAVAGMAAKAVGLSAKLSPVAAPASEKLTVEGKKLLDNFVPKPDRFSVQVAGVDAAAGKKAIDQAATTAAFGPVVGGMEGGGAGQQAFQAVMDMDPAKLAESPVYQELLKAGKTPEEAQKQIASSAASIAFTPAAVVGAVTGALVAKIELNPLSAKGVGGLTVNAAKETLEESAQGVSGQLASNAGVKFSGADPDQNLGEGVGGAAAQGAIAGAGTTVLTQGPGSVVKTAVDATVGTARASIKGALKVAGVAAEPFIKMDAKIKAARAAASPTSPENMAPAVQTAAENAPKVAEDLRTMAAEAGAKGAEIDAYIKRVEEASSIQNDDLAYMPGVVGQRMVAAREQLGRMPNRFEALAMAAVVASDESKYQPDRVAAATFITKMIAANRKLFQEDLPGFIEQIPQDREEFKQFNQYASLLTAIENTKEIQDAIAFGQTADLSEVDLTTTEGKKIVGQTAELAAIAPLDVNPALADQILAQMESDSSNLSPEDRATLQARSATLSGVSALHKAKASYDEAIGSGATGSQKFGKGDTKATSSEGLDFVSNQIETEGGTNERQLSLVQHVQTISEALSSAKPKLIKERITKLAKFAASHRNKVEAINTSIATGKQEVPYQSFDPKGEEFTARGVGVSPKSAGQVNFARKVHAEATAIAMLANSFIEKNPKLGLDLVVVPALALGGNQEGSSTTAPVASAPSQATTTRTDDTSVQSEPPSDPAQTEVRDEVDAAPFVGERTSKAFDQIVAKLSKRLGLPDLKGLVNGFIDTPLPPGRRGFFQRSTGRMAIATKVLERFEDREIAASYLYRIAAHELGHAIDDAAGSAEGDLFTKDHPTFALGGDLWNEFKTVRGKSPEAAYEPDWSYLKKWADKGENFDIAFFAELFSFVVTNPKAAQELIPNGVAIVEEIVSRAGQARGIEASVTGRVGVAGLGSDSRSVVPTEGQSAEQTDTDTAEEVSTAPVAELSNDTLQFIYENEAEGDLDIIKEMISRGELASAQEKQSDPATWSPEENEAYDTGNTRLFSTLRGYTSAEIANFERYQLLANTLIDKYGVDFVAGLTQPEPASTETSAEEDAGQVSDADIVAAIEGIDESESPEILKTSEAFPTLVQAAGKNYFWLASKLPRRQRSKMFGLSEPLRQFFDVLSDPKSLVAFMGKEISKYEIKAQDRKNAQRLLDVGNAVGKFLEDRMERLLKAKRKSAAGEPKPTLQERLDAGEDIQRWRNFRALNITEKINGDYRYNQTLLDAAIVAGLDWVMNAGDRSTPVSRETVAGMLGVDVDALKDDWVEEFNHGLSFDSAARGLAENIRKFWGIETNNDTDQAFVEGVPEAVAKEILIGLQDQGLLSLGTVTFPDSPSKKQFGRVWIDSTSRNKDMDELITSLNGVSNVFADMALIDREVEGHSFEPVTDVSKTVLHNEMVPLTDQHARALENTQAAAHYPNMPMFDLITGMTREQFVTLFSGRPYKDGDLKKDHREMGYNKGNWASVKGVQRTLVSTYDSAVKYLAQIESHAAQRRKDAVRDPSLRGNQLPTINDVGLYFRHQINKLGRPQMAGLNNPQSNKGIRHLLMPTRGTLDLSEIGSADFQKFTLMVGQGIGLKPEQVKPVQISDTEVSARGVIMGDVIAQTMTQGGKYRAVVEVMKTWLQSRDQGKKVLGTEFMELITKIQAEKTTALEMHGLLSLMDVARYELARDTGNGSGLVDFETMNYLEADGKTNGSANALMLFATGPITPEWLRTIGKVGAYFGRLGKTLNMHMIEDKDDLYAEGSAKTAQNVAARGRAIAASGKEPSEHFEAFQRFLINLDMNVEQNEETGGITIKRGGVKNPMTITIYGSGAKGIAENVTNELIAVIYEALTEKVKNPSTSAGDLLYGQGGSNDFIQDLQRLSSKVVRKNSKTGEYFVTGDNLALPKDPADFEFSAEQFNNMRENIQLMLIAPMVEAIDATVTDHVSGVTKSLQEMTQIQSIFAKAHFIRLVTERLAMKQANPENSGFKKGDFLSKNELDAILKRVLAFIPMISTGTQSYYFGGGEKADLFDKTTHKIGDQEITVNFPKAFSTSMDGQLETNAFINGPTLTGVAAIPTTVVGSGDGQMQLNALAGDAEFAKRVEHVFDGLQMPGEMIDAYSEYINKAVYETWTGNKNVVRAAYESFASFMNNSPIETVFGSIKDGSEGNAQQRDALRELSKVYHEKGKVGPGEIIGVEDARWLMDQVAQSMSDLADETDARRLTYPEFDLSVDQMASGERPYSNQGTINLAPDATHEQIAKAMTERYEFHLAAIRKNRGAAPVPVGGALENIGKVELDTGVRVLQVSDLPALYKGLQSKLSPTQKEMMREATKLLEGSGYRIVFGESGQLDAWEEGNNFAPDGTSRFVRGSNNEQGKIDPVSKIITISSVKAETVIHELVHAATIDKIRAYYADEKSVDPLERDAIKRIEGLMEEWLAIDPGRENADGHKARTIAMAEIARRTAKGQKAEALNEFMAWVLGNQDLAVLAQKTKVKNRALQIIGDALVAIRQAIWPTKSTKTPLGDNILTNLRFNTRVLMAGITPIEQLQADFTATAMFQSKAFGVDSRLTELRDRINNRIIAWLDGDGTLLDQKLVKPKRIAEDKALDRLSGQLTGQFAFYFNDLKTMQAASTFAMVQKILMTGIELNTTALSRVQDLYEHVTSELKYTDFMADPTSTDQQDIQDAQAKHGLILGKFNTITDKFGRSSLMSSFLALAVTSDEFREVLSKLSKPKADKSTATGLDGVVETTANGVVDWLSMVIAGEGRTDGNIRDAIDSLTTAMIGNVSDQKQFIAKTVEGGLDTIETAMADLVQNTSETVLKKAAEINRTTKSRIVKVGASAAYVVATAINEQAATEASLGLISNLNKVKGWEPFKSLVSDVVGRTRENAPLFDMISKVRAWVSRLRQEFRDELPKKLNRMFKIPVSAEQWTAMFKVLGKTDLAAITGSYGLAGALEMVTDDKRRAKEIAKLEAKFDPVILNKAKQLANFMVTGDYGVMLLSNAYAISALSRPGVRNLTPAPDMVEEIERLVTLYAIDQTDPAALDIVADLIENTEKEGVEFVTSYLMGQRVDEIAKVNNTPQARINAYKGHIPSESQSKGSLIIASDTEYTKLVGRGYTRVRDYTGSTADRGIGKRGYYYAPVSGQAPFSQGVLQTVHQTASGVDPETGFTAGEITAGRITDPQAIRLTERLLANQAPGTENLRPVFDETGKIIAFERMADLAMLARLDRSTNLAEMIGAWRGRQAEETAAQESNRQLIDVLKDTWDKGVKEGKQNQFVNIATLDPKTTDKILLEAASLVPSQTVGYVKQVFGPGTFMVRRDMLLDTFGARQASVGDLFSGDTRWNPKAAREFEKVITGMFGMFGKDAFNTLVGSEQNIQDVIANVKQTIVVKSVIVPVANAISNMVQLLNRGVPLKAIIHGFGAKSSEINSYVKRRQREIDLEADLRAAEGKNDTGAALKIGNQIQSIRDSYKRMSIWPLIEAGEFSAISSGQVTAEDLAIVDGKWSNFIEKKVNELQEPFRTMARYGLVTKDTALFQGLARAVQYGDFVAKAVLYDDLTSRKKVPQKEAIAKVNEAFINYNRLSGRFRQYMENMGLMWFYSYKLRSIKEAAYLLRHNPLRSLLMTAVPPVWMIGDIGSPVIDNAAALGADGKLGLSRGPGMACGSWQLNPWINAIR
jgi:hypothetical protein